jgi:hypothetical protein
VAGKKGRTTAQAKEKKTVWRWLFAFRRRAFVSFSLLLDLSAVLVSSASTLIPPFSSFIWRAIFQLDPLCALDFLKF